MEKFIKGDIVVIPFPFSDLSQSKRRPALILSCLPGNDLILCQITSQQISDLLSIPLKSSDIEKGSLKFTSNIRPNRLFTADKAIILYKVGSIKELILDSVIEKIIFIMKEY